MSVAVTTHLPTPAAVVLHDQVIGQSLVPDNLQKTAALQPVNVPKSTLVYTIHSPLTSYLIDTTSHKTRVTLNKQNKTFKVCIVKKMLKE